MDNLDQCLFNTFEKEYAPNKEYQAHLMEQYKLYIEMTDRTSARRLVANSFFVTVNTALLAFLGITVSQNSLLQQVGILIVPVTGFFLCRAWQQMVHAYKNLNTGRFEVIHAIERRLPLFIYSAEWQCLGMGEQPSRYLPLTQVETRVPIVFSILYVIFFVGAVIPVVPDLIAFASHVLLIFRYLMEHLTTNPNSKIPSNVPLAIRNSIEFLRNLV